MPLARHGLVCTSREKSVLVAENARLDEKRAGFFWIGGYKNVSFCSVAKKATILFVIIIGVDVFSQML